MVRCPKCAEVQKPRLCCTSCGTPLGAELDAFAALGLERKLTLDQATLEQRYHELGRRIHPDRFASETASVRAASLKSTANLTKAYRALRDPVSRGLYWLELHGRKLNESNQAVPSDLATIVFEIQDQLDQLRHSKPSEATRLRADVDDSYRQTESALEAALTELGSNFAEWDRQGDEQSEELFTALKLLLARIAYLRTLLRDIEKTLEIAQAA